MNQEANWNLKEWKNDQTNLPKTGILPSKEALIFLPLPRVTRNGNRIILVRIENPDLSLFHEDHVINQIYETMKFLKEHDYVHKIYFLADLYQFSEEHLAKVSIVEMAATIVMAQKMFQFKLTTLKFLNTPDYMLDAIQTFINELPPHFVDKVEILKGVDGLYDSVLTKKCLPRDYSGYLPTVKILLKRWDHIFGGVDNSNFKSISKSHL